MKTTVVTLSKGETVTLHSICGVYRVNLCIHSAAFFRNTIHNEKQYFFLQKYLSSILCLMYQLIPFIPSIVSPTTDTIFNNLHNTDNSNLYIMFESDLENKNSIFEFFFLLFFLCAYFWTFFLQFLFSLSVQLLRKNDGNFSFLASLS